MISVSSSLVVFDDSSKNQTTLGFWSSGDMGMLNMLPQAEVVDLQTILFDNVYIKYKPPSYMVWYFRIELERLNQREYST